MDGTRSPFPRIADCAFLSDCHTGALVAPDGSVEWLCLPRFDSASVFGAILDREAGHFRVGPPDWHVPVGRRYEPGTNMLETTWMTATGWVVVRDALTIGPWRGQDPHVRRPPAHDADHLLLRTLECIKGEAEMEVSCRPVFDYGSRSATWRRSGDDPEALDAADGDFTIRLTSDMPLGASGDTAGGRYTLREGEKRFCALSWAPDLLCPSSIEDANFWLERTSNFWRTWLASASFTDHPWRVYLERSALVLKGLTYAPTGATVAAPTTSLPETPGGERNWDYRFTWIRDATFTLYALHLMGLDREANDFMEFVGDVCRKEGPGLHIMYGIQGEADIEERTLDHLSGYEGAKPVRVGNAAFLQRQNDVYGSLLDSVYIHSKVQGELPDSFWPVVQDQVEIPASVWRLPDQGIWETRGEPKHYVSSKLMCWVALERGARLARQRGEKELAGRWAKIAEEIRAEILLRGVSPRGVFRQHYDTDALDASTLLVPLVRFLPPDDVRTRATVLAIADELTEQGLVLRYRVEETDDGLRGKEGSFTICSFWLVSALSEIGERERARVLCERLLNFAGALGLYAEEIEPESGRHLGNFPQAFTHLALINAVTHVIADDLAPPDRELSTSVFKQMPKRR